MDLVIVKPAAGDEMEAQLARGGWPMTSLKAVKIIVTGGSSGIGSACVRGYARNGAKVAVLDIQTAPGELLCQSLRDEGWDAQFWRCDVSVRGEVDAAFDAAGEWLGGLDVLAHVAGVSVPCPAIELGEEQIRAALDINFMGAVFTNQAACRLMTNGGRIINVGSIAAVRPMLGFAHYGASKAAVHAWTRAVAAEWAFRGISVNVVAPTAITPMALSIADHLPEPERSNRLDAMRKSNPQGRVLNPEDGVLPLMSFLASPGAAYITGQTLSADGGAMMLGS
jgi:3-oxoacyl-[acyl-carrier protein] reductase